MSVLFPDPLDPTSAVVVPAGARKLTSFSTGTPASYSKPTSLENHFSVDRPERCLAAVLFVLGRHLEKLANPVEAGESFADLRADGRDLHDRRGHQPGQDEVEDEVAERHRARRESTRPPMTIIMTPITPTTTVENAVIADTPVIDLRDVAKQPVHALA